MIVGISEDNPSFDEAPGVTPDESRRMILDQCRSLLAPTVMPEIIEVPLDASPGKVLLIIRVEPAGLLVPIVLAGSVYVRASGASFPATREQIITLVKRSEASQATAGGGRSLNNFTPLISPMVGRDLPDARIRVAGAVHLRPRIGQLLSLGKTARSQLRACIDASALVGYFRGEHLHLATADGWEVLEQSATHLLLQRIYRSDDGNYVMAVRTHLEGTRVLFLVDIDLRCRTVDSVMPTIRTGPPPSLSQQEIAILLGGGLLLVALDLPDAVASIAGNGNLRVESPIAWVYTNHRPLNLLPDLNELQSRSSKHETVTLKAADAPSNESEAQETLREWLRSFYLALGCDDELTPSDRGVAVATEALGLAM